MADIYQQEQEPESYEALSLVERLDAFGLSLFKLRKEAIEGRRHLGIEDEWTQDEEAYDGIDDANRDDSKGAWSTKPPGQMSAKSARDTRSTVFVNITRPYVDSASSRIADMMLPVDEKAWSIESTPIPDLIDATRSQGVVIGPDGQQIPEAVIAQAMIDQAKGRAEKAEKRIDDWLAESQWNAEFRNAIDDAAKVGTGILKGPCPIKRRHMKWSVENGIGRLSVEEIIQPGSRRINYWNFFPDPACGEDIHNGSYVWERDYLTAKQLTDLIGLPGYMPDQILKCLEEGPQKAEYADGRDVKIERNNQIEGKRFEIWYYYGLAEADDVRATGEYIEDDRKIPVIVTMVNNRVVKATPNPLDTGEFPYDLMTWQMRPGLPWGRGVARQINTPQRWLNAAVRNMMDNASMAAGPMVVVMNGVVTPLDGKFSIGPRKVWLANDNATVADVRAAFQIVEIPMRQQELEAMVMLALRFAEESTGLPMILQGQMGQKAPDTVGGMTMLQNNASSVLRRLARVTDEQIIKPHIRRYYDWLMQYGEDEAEKGEYQIIAKGSSALVERDLQNQQLPQIIQMALQPAFGISPEKTAEELLRSWRFDPRQFKFSDAEKAQIQQQQAGQAQPDQASAELEQQKMQMESVEAEMEALRLENERLISERERDAQLQDDLSGIREAAANAFEEL
jgi:hypothetical protein